MTIILQRLSLLLVVFATSSPAVPGADPYRDSQLPTNERVQDLLGRMTLEEKIEQLTQKDAGRIEMQGNNADPASLEKLFGDRSPGVLCVKFGDDLQQTAHRLVAGQRYLREQTRLGIPALTVNEGLHGVLAQGATIYPQFLAVGCTWNPDLAQAMGAQISAEASAAGVNHLLTPMIEVVRDPRWGRVTTPERKLVGFTKIELKPGESRRLAITIPNGELALWNRQMKRVVEPGSFTLMVGSSAETIALRGGFQAVAAVGNGP